MPKEVLDTLIESCPHCGKPVKIEYHEFNVLLGANVSIMHSTPSCDWWRKKHAEKDTEGFFQALKARDRAKRD